MNRASWFVGSMAAAILFGAAGCGSSASSSSSSSSGTGCSVAFDNVQAAGATLVTTPFHDDHAIELFWNPKMSLLDVLGGDVADKPIRAFEVELHEGPIVDGATIQLRAFDPTDRAFPTSYLTFSTSGAPQLTSTSGTARITTASSTRLVFAIDAVMETLDENQAVVPGAPSLTMSVRCDVPASYD